MKVSLVDLRLSGTRTETVQIFEDAMEKLDEKAVQRWDFISTILDSCTCIAVSKCKSEGSLRNLRGSWFEFAVALVLLEKHIKPFYVKATLANVPDVFHDLIIYTKGDIPVVLSLKTSMRERYKQIDREGKDLKSVYRRAVIHFLTLNSKANVERLKRKIANKDVLGIDAVHGENDFEELFASLGGLTVIDAPPGVLTGKKVG